MTTVFFVFSVIGAHAQSVVTGSVKDGSGEPIIGATIMEKGTSNGGVTDLDGSFSIKVGDHATLVVSYVGYERQEVPVAGKSTVNIVLTESDRTIDEVVVVGYGAIAKRSVSTAISTVKGDRIAGMPTSNVAQSLVGMSSGITLQQVNGEPGAAPAIRIRGAGSINSGNDPLYVIDGYPTTDSELFNSISPTDIDDIQILKDAASSAIYGSKAGNGVIIVTTKSGRTGKSRVSFSTQIGVNQVQRYVDVLGSKDYLDMIIEARTNNGTIGNFPGLLKLRESGDYANTNWQDEIFRNALNYRANANVTGGNENVTYHFSVNYQNEDGILLNSYYRKVNVKGGFDARLNKYVKIGVGFSPTYTKKRAQQPAGGGTEDVTGVIAEALSYPPILPVWQPNGDYTQIAQHYTRYGLNNQLRNPVANLLENSNDSWSIRTLTNAYIEIKPLKSLTVRSSVDLSTNSTKLDYYQSACLLGANETGNKSTPNLSAIDAYRASGLVYHGHL